MLIALGPDATDVAASSAAERLQRAGAFAVVGFSLLALGYRCFIEPDIPFLAGRGWITNERVVDARIQQYGVQHVPVARFARSFALVEAPRDARLSVEAARSQRVLVNGAPVWESRDPDWRRARAADVAEHLRAGENEIEIEVSNPLGPPLLRARLTAAGTVIATDSSWSVAVDGGAPSAAVAPDDTRAHPSAPASPRPARALARQAPLVAAIFLVAGLVLAVARSWLADRRGRLPWLALALVHVAWLWLFAAKFTRIPLTTGFDASHHLAYVEILTREHRVPLPTDGWSTYHPPLYYVSVALLQEAVAGTGAELRNVVTKLPSFLAGLGGVWVTFGLARALLGARPELVAVAVSFSGVVPLLGYTSAYVSNEPLHGALFGLATLLCVRALLRPRVGLGDAALVGGAVGLALLAKTTALVAAAVAGFALVSRAALGRDRPRVGAALAVAAAYATSMLALCGWFYARNVRLHGTPIVGNWALPGSAWWSQPGFHTPAYYAGFGESLVRPALSGFRSFGDSLYSSFWGDGWIAGRASAAFPPEAWNWDLMAVGYWLALPATAALAWGLARATRLAFARSEGFRRGAWSYLLLQAGALGFAMLVLTLELPYFGQAKAPYLLGIVPPLAVVFALGVDSADRALGLLGGEAARLIGRAFWLGSGCVLWLGLAG
jgi:hypothetical protein